MPAWQIWTIVGASSVVVSALVIFLWLRMPIFQWYCRRCKKIVRSGRLYPRKCTCDSKVLVAYFCQGCGSWNTSPTANWHCGNCRSHAIMLGAEYHLDQGMWRWRNRAAAGRLTG